MLFAQCAACILWRLLECGSQERKLVKILSAYLVTIKRIFSEHCIFIHEILSTVKFSDFCQS